MPECEKHTLFETKNRFFPKTVTLFLTKIFDFPHPIYDLIKKSIPYL